MNLDKPLGTATVLFVGFGSIAQAIAPLLLSHWRLSPGRVRAIAADADGADVAASLGIDLAVTPLLPSNFEAVLSDELSPGDVLINVSVDVSSKALIKWCQAHGVLYLDTCVEPWKGGYFADDGTSQADTTNYALREDVLALQGAGKPTAVIAHGANPGIISHLAKAGLLEMAAARGLKLPDGPHAFARLSQALGVRVIQIAERDTQRALAVPPGAFVNTWSASGLLSEAWQSAECGWGTHEKTLPAGAREHTFGSCSGIYLNEHSVEVCVQSWVPHTGAQYAYLITHHEALSLAELLTVPAEEGRAGSPEYRPTVYYAYTPSDATQESLAAWVARDFAEPTVKRVLRDELVAGEDRLGVLFVFDGGAFWYGSTVELKEARGWTPYANATSLQVVGGVLGALNWMVDNPSAGVVEAEDLPHQEVLDVALPYLGHVRGYWTTWQPEARHGLAPAGELQFSDFRA